MQSGLELFAHVCDGPLGQCVLPLPGLRLMSVIDDALKSSRALAIDWSNTSSVCCEPRSRLIPQASDSGGMRRANDIDTKTDPGFRSSVGSAGTGSTSRSTTTAGSPTPRNCSTRAHSPPLAFYAAPEILASDDRPGLFEQMKIGGPFRRLSGFVEAGQELAHIGPLHEVGIQPIAVVVEPDPVLTVAAAGIQRTTQAAEGSMEGEAVVQAVTGRAEVYLDGGVRRGTDVVTALALGARGVFIGRPYVFVLAAGGQDGRRPMRRDPGGGAQDGDDAPGRANGRRSDPRPGDLSGLVANLFGGLVPADALAHPGPSAPGE